jgi:phenylalanine-4-hydroxylase
MEQQVYGNPKGHGESDDYAPYIIDQGWDKYTAEEHETWNILFDRQKEIAKDRACNEQMQGLKDLAIGADGIPDFRALSKKMEKTTGWQVVAVPGLIPDLPFFKLLADRKFPAGNFIRRRDQLNYIQEPDVFHDVYGHVPLLANPVFADYLAAYGRGGLRAHQEGTITNLARLYWYTVEFGLINTAEGLRIYGAGIISSPGETVFSLEDKSPNRVKFDLKRVMQTSYRVDDYQQTYFVIDSFKQLFDETYADFGPLYKDLKREQTVHAPDALAAGDKIITRGTQDYARAKKAAAAK